jgi:D-xylose transport system substrate-binding protein
MSAKRTTAVLLAITASAVVALALSSCGGEGKEKVKIAFLLPEGAGTRFAKQDGPLFVRRVKQLCSSCEVTIKDARDDPALQVSQGLQAIRDDADVIVLDPVGSTSSDLITKPASLKGIPVISYDRLQMGGHLSYFVGYDDVQVGRLQAQALLAKLKATGQSDKPVVMLTGSPFRHDVKLARSGARAVFRGQVPIAALYGVRDSNRFTARDDMAKAIAKLGSTGFAAVYAYDDSIAGGAIAAMKAAGIDPKTKPTTGQNAELSAIRRILSGEQYMTIYRPVPPEADLAARVAVAYARGEEGSLPAAFQSTTIGNGFNIFFTRLLKPIAVTRDNIAETVVKDGLWTTAQICTPALRKECASAGLK